jgi:hypothetical protein
MSTLKTVNVIHPSGVTNNIVNDASGNVTVGNNITVTGTLTGSTGVMNVGSGQIYKDSSGNVGIGTTSPATKLQVSSSTFPSGDEYGFIQANYTGTNTLVNAGITVKNYQGTSQFMQWEAYGLRIGSRVKTNTGTGQVIFTYGNDSEGMRIDASGNVGIGNAASNVNDQVGSVRPLLVSGSDGATTIAGSLASIVIGNSNTTTSNTSQLGFAALTGANSTYFTSAAINCVFGARTNGQYPTGQLVFSTSTSLNTAPTEKMRITSSGSVLVGSTAQIQSEKLGVTAGTANATQYQTISTVGGSTLLVNQQQTTSVSTTATTILNGPQYMNFCLVYGVSGSNRFADVVLMSVGTGTVNVISSLTASGTPAARTYSQSASTFRLAMASGTYTVQVTCLAMGT